MSELKARIDSKARANKARKPAQGGRKRHLTLEQEQLVVTAYTRDDGSSPSIRELADSFEVSPSCIWRTLFRARRGLVRL